MLIENRLSIRQWNTIINGALLLSLTLLFLSCVAVPLVWMLPFWGEGGSLGEPRLQPKKPLMAELEENLGLEGVSIPLPHVQEKVLFLGVDKRPGGEGGVWLATEAGQKNLYHLGDKVFLQCEDEDHVLFSSMPTPFWLELEAFAHATLQATFVSEYKTPQGELLFSARKELQFVQRSWRERDRDVAMDKAIASLTKIKCYLPDQLIELYGGPVFKEIRGKRRIDFDGKGERLHFVGGGEKFVWTGEEWVPGLPATEEEGRPILWLERIEGQQSHFLLFDEQGYTVQSLTIPQENAFPIRIKATELFEGLRMRSAQSVLCKVMQHNMILRTGDWLLRSKNGWRNLQSSEELKKYLCYARAGELFIFDGIILAPEGYLFTGHLFDEKRTSVQKITLPLGSAKILKKNAKDRSKRQGIEEIEYAEHM